MREWLHAIVVLVLLLPLHAYGAERAVAAVAPLRVIVHPSNPASSVERSFLAAAFLKKTTRWPDDRVIRPVDEVAKASVRHVFSESVLQRTVESVKSYWRQIIFSGRGVPPPEFASDAEVVEYVLRNPGGIGYVSGAANIDGAKILQVR